MTEEEHLILKVCEERVVLGASGADLGCVHEVELETFDGRGGGLTSFGAAVGIADEASDGMTSFGVAVGAVDERDDEVGFKGYDRRLSGSLELVFVSGSGSIL